MNNLCISFFLLGFCAANFVCHFIQNKVDLLNYSIIFNFSALFVVSILLNFELSIKVLYLLILIFELFIIFRKKNNDR